MTGHPPNVDYRTPCSCSCKSRLHVFIHKQSSGPWSSEGWRMRGFRLLRAVGGLMDPFFVVAILLVAATLVAVLIAVGMRASKLARELDAAERKLEAAQSETRTAVAELAK